MVDVLTVEAHDRVMETLLDHLSHRSDWDTACLQKLLVDSPTLKALESLLPERLPWHRVGHMLHPYLAINESWEGFYRTANPSFQEMHQRLQVQLQRTRGINIEEQRTVDFEDPLFQKALESISRDEKVDRGLFVGPMRRTAEFFRELTRRASKNGWLSLWSMRLDGHVVAVEYQLRSNGKVQTLWASDDPIDDDVMAGRALRSAIIHSLFQDGCVSEYSGGPTGGDDYPWWATGANETVDLQIYRTGIYSGMLHGLETAIAPWARKLRERMTTTHP
jgi:hypothetical protein